MTNDPRQPDSSHIATDRHNVGFPPVSQDPSRVRAGLSSTSGIESFPIEAVAELRADTQNAVGEDSLIVRRNDLALVLNWIDRYVPRALPGCTVEPQAVGAIQTLVIENTGLEDLDLVRVDGRPFVPETPAIVSALDELSAEDRGVLVTELASFADEFRYSEPESGVFGSDALGNAADHLRRIVIDSGPAAGRCRYCGCDEDHACDRTCKGDGLGACSWIEGTNETLCSNPDCVERALADRAAGNFPELLLTPEMEVAPGRLEGEDAHGFVDRSEGGHGRTSIKKSHRAEGRNFIG